MTQVPNRRIFPAPSRHPLALARWTCRGGSTCAPYSPTQGVEISPNRAVPATGAKVPPTFKPAPTAAAPFHRRFQRDPMEWEKMPEPHGRGSS